MDDDDALVESPVDGEDDEDDRALHGTPSKANAAINVAITIIMVFCNH